MDARRLHTRRQTCRILPLHACTEDTSWHHGRQAEAARANVGLSANWGGAREKGEAPKEAWCHPAVVAVRAANIAASVAAAGLQV